MRNEIAENAAFIICVSGGWRPVRFFRPFAPTVSQAQHFCEKDGEFFACANIDLNAQAGKVSGDHEAGTLHPGTIGMGKRSRPLSPHLQIYRFQWTMLFSITHRITGVGLAAGTFLLVWWLSALAIGPDAFAIAQHVMGSWIGRLLLLGWTWAFFYHFSNGIRHLCWDAGWGFDLDTARGSAMAVAGASVVLTLAFWIAVYFLRGAL